MPVTGDDGVPLTYVSRAEAEAFCAANGVRLPTEVEWEAAARGGDDRLWPWGDEPPDTTRATFGQGIGGPSRGRAAPGGGRAVRRAGHGGQRLGVDGRRRGARRLVPERAADELRCSARLPVHPAARDPYVGFRVVAVEPRRSFDWVEVPAGDYVIGRDAGRVASAGRRRGRVRARADARHERAVRALRRRDGRAAPPHWPAPGRPSRHVRRLARGVRVLRLGQAAGCRPRPSGRRPRAAPTGARTRGATRRTRAAPRSGAGLKHGSTSPVGSHPDGASPYGLLDMAGNVWEWTSTEYPPGERVLRGGSFASPGLAWARCTMRSHSRPGRRQAHIGFRVARERHERRRGPPARPDPGARRGREPDRRHRRGRAALRAAARGDRDGGRAARRAVPGDADRDRPAARGGPGRRSSSTATSTRCRSRTSRRGSTARRSTGAARRT